MILNTREDPWSPDTAAWVPSEVFLDGRKIEQVWYVDTEATQVKTYDVLGDGAAHAAQEKLPWPEEAEALGDGIGPMSITLRGTRVEVRKMIS